MACKPYSVISGSLASSILPGQCAHFHELQRDLCKVHLGGIASSIGKLQTFQDESSSSLNSIVLFSLGFLWELF